MSQTAQACGLTHLALAAPFDYLIGTVPAASADRTQRDLRADAQAGERPDEAS